MFALACFRPQIYVMLFPVICLRPHRIDSHWTRWFIDSVVWLKWSTEYLHFKMLQIFSLFFCLVCCAPLFLFAFCRSLGMAQAALSLKKKHDLFWKFLSLAMHAPPPKNAILLISSNFVVLFWYGGLGFFLSLHSAASNSNTRSKFYKLHEQRSARTCHEYIFSVFASWKLPFWVHVLICS